MTRDSWRGIALGLQLLGSFAALNFTLEAFSPQFPVLFGHWPFWAALGMIGLGTAINHWR